MLQHSANMIQHSHTCAKRWCCSTITQVRHGCVGTYGVCELLAPPPLPGAPPPPTAALRPRRPTAHGGPPPTAAHRPRGGNEQLTGTGRTNNEHEDRQMQLHWYTQEHIRAMKHAKPKYDPIPISNANMTLIRRRFARFEFGLTETAKTGVTVDFSIGKVNGQRFDRLLFHWKSKRSEV